MPGFPGQANTSAPGWAAFAVNDDGVKGGFGMVTLGSTLKLALKMTGRRAIETRACTARLVMTTRRRGWVVERLGMMGKIRTRA